MFKVIFFSFFVSSTASAYSNNYKYPRNTPLTIDSSILGQCFSQVVQKNFDLRSIKLKQHRDLYPNLFDYLTGNLDNDYSTGRELFLKNWVGSQKDNSINPLSIFKQSLLLNNGDIFNAVLTIHQLLRNEARFYKRYIHYNSSFEQKEMFFNKFIDIRGDLEERTNGTGDHSGSWYRLWGTMLSYLSGIEIKEVLSFPQKDLSSQLTFDNFYNSKQIKERVIEDKNELGICGQEFSSLAKTLAKGFGISSLAEWIKYPLSLIPGENWIEKDTRKASINRAGYLTAHSLVKSLKGGNVNLSCNPDDYIK
jgi:hypothetical protein